jgi:hypothetical protein
MAKYAHTYAMSPKQRFPVMLEPGQVAALKAIERATGAPVGEQIRRAITAYLENQKVLPKTEVRKLLAG